MHRRTVHRGIFALALVVLLTCAGARPAAASDLSLMDRLHRLWSAVTVSQPAQPGFWEQLTGWFGGAKPTKAVSSPDMSEKGWGLDPNGNSLTSTVNGSGS
jgi:hypothetical protein